MKLSVGVRGELRLFAFYLANRTLDAEILPNSLDYSGIFDEASALEQAFAIWGNVVEIDAQGKVLNAPYASKRVAQYIRSYHEPTFSVEPPFDDRELELLL